MRTWSRAHTLIAGSVIIAATNVVALAGAAYNRSGTPESTLELSERELNTPSDWGFEGENSGIALEFRWHVVGTEDEDAHERSYYFPSTSGAPGWLDSAKLAELGFDVSSMEDTTGARARYGRQLPREVLLVLELDGPAYHETLARIRAYARHVAARLAADPDSAELARRAEHARDLLAKAEKEGTRLYVVDAGLDAAKLRDTYPSRARHAIVRGTVRPWLMSSDGRWYLAGVVSGPSVPRINVPLAFRAPFERRQGRRGWNRADDPFTVTVAFGQRLEPWIVSASGTTNSR